jgi:TorA maturation chaperone TorD
LFDKYIVVPLIENSGDINNLRQVFAQYLYPHFMPKSSPTDHFATIYRFCAQSMQYPAVEWLNDTYFNSLYQLLESLSGEDEAENLRNMIVQSDNILEELQIEYTRLFINGVPHVAAPPYASVYLEKTLRGKYSENILLYYQSKGYSLKPSADLPDNIIHQLEFLSFLTEDLDKEGEIEFLTKYFLPWFSIFAARVLEEAEHPFYQVIISLIDFFTKEEEEYGI